MKTTLAALLMAGLWQTGSPADLAPVHGTDFRYIRPIRVPAGPEPAACAVLAAGVFAHSDPTLNDLRVFSQQATPAEVPFVLTTSRTEPVGDAAKVVNLGMTGDRISFDLEMPARPYTDIDLELTGTDFIATAKVTGYLHAPEQPVALGSFTVFDLSSQHLGRSTRLPLQEATFPLLHIELTVGGAPGHPFTASPAMVAGAQIPPSREAQTLYTTVAETTAIAQVGRETLATFDLPARVPVERIEFELTAGDHRNFSRAVRILARPVPPKHPPVHPATGMPLAEEIEGSIERIHTTLLGHTIDVENLAVPATIGSNTRAAVRLEVAIENGDDRPIALHAVRLAMRERKLCFDAPAEPVALFYGADAMRAPVYDYSRLFQPAAPTRVATLGAEQVNAAYHPVPAAPKTLAESHPQLVWLALLAAIAILGTIAFRSAKRV